MIHNQYKTLSKQVTSFCSNMQHGYVRFNGIKTISWAHIAICKMSRTHINISYRTCRNWLNIKNLICLDLKDSRLPRAGLQAAAAGHHYRNQTEPKYMHDCQHPIDVTARWFSVAKHEGPATQNTPTRKQNHRPKIGIRFLPRQVDNVVIVVLTKVAKGDVESLSVCAKEICAVIRLQQDVVHVDAIDGSQMLLVGGDHRLGAFRRRSERHSVPLHEPASHQWPIGQQQFKHLWKLFKKLHFKMFEKLKFFN